jgi:ATP-dependent protease ClpP protease subunit
MSSAYPDDPAVTEALIRKLQAEADAAMADAESKREQVKFDKISRKKHELELAKEKRADVLERAADYRNYTYNFVKAVGESPVNECIAVLSRWARMGATEITIVFTSPGGEVFSGFALFDFIMGLRKQGIHITTVCRGYAASMAGILLQAGDWRIMGQESYLLIHEIATGAVGKAFEIKDEAEFLDLMMERVYRIFSDRSDGKTSAKELKRLVERKDYWCDSKESKKRGFVDEIS